MLNGLLLNCLIVECGMLWFRWDMDKYFRGSAGFELQIQTNINVQQYKRVGNIQLTSTHVLCMQRSSGLSCPLVRHQYMEYLPVSQVLESVSVTSSGCHGVYYRVAGSVTSIGQHQQYRDPGIYTKPPAPLRPGHQQEFTCTSIYHQLHSLSTSPFKYSFIVVIGGFLFGKSLTF